MKVIKFENEKKYINDFLNLPKKIYTKKTNTENKETIKQLITNTHPLNKYFKLTKFVVYKNEQVVGRFAITEYPDDKINCYLGFFECIKDNKVDIKKNKSYIKKIRKELRKILRANRDIYPVKQKRYCYKAAYPFIMKFYTLKELIKSKFKISK